MRALFLSTFVAVFFPFCSFGQAPFEMPKQFSADLETVVGPMKNTMKLFVDGQKTRAEISSPMGDTVMITRVDTKVSYTLMAAQKQYMEMPLTDMQAKASDMSVDPKATWEKLGSETINGRACDKYRVTTIPADNPQQKTVAVFYVDSANRIPVRTVTGEGEQAVTVDFKNFKPGAQEASLFEPPKDYSKFSLPALQNMPMPIPSGQ